MLFNTSIVSTVAILMASQVMGAPTEATGNEARAVLIATDPGYACTCPNNCDHHAGSSCKYYSGPSDNSPIIEGN
ncbi:hypothetical protein MGN70_010278 [Eutypa lata]|nr:hypothetical protein MGN70_010278 [Eutypa lata]